MCANYLVSSMLDLFERAGLVNIAHEGFNQHGRAAEYPLSPSSVRPTSRRKRMSALWQTVLDNYE